MKKTFKKASPLICFREWGNKSYSAFNSLKKCVKIGVLCATYCMVTAPEQSFAQSDTIVRVVDLDEVEVNAERSPDIFTPAGRVITQINRSDLEHAPVQSLSDMLEYVPNIDLRQRGPYGTQADVSVRGSSFDQTMILLNGINLSDPQTGHYSLNLPVDLESVEKIEILEGPASRIFGNNALGGAVNFITGTQPDNYLKAYATGGEYGYYKVSLSGSIHSKHTTSHLSVSHSASDGYMPNTDFKNWHIFTQNKWNNVVFPIDLQLGYTQKELGANGFYGPRYPNQHETLNTYYVALKGASTGKVKVSPSVYWRRNYDHYILIRENPEAYQNFHYTDVYGLDMPVSFFSRLGKTTIGILLREEKIYSNNLGIDTDNHKKVPGQDDKWYTKTDHRTNVSAFAEQNLYLGNWNASLGVSFNHNSYTDNKIKIYPGVDLSYRVSNLLKIYASANRAMRLPTFTDLYYHGAMNLGNPDLKPEYCTEYEVGAKLTSGGWNIQAGYFYRNTTDAIDWIWLQEEQKWHTQNLTELHTQGVSVTSNWNLRSLVSPGFFIHSATAAYSFMYSDKSSDEFTSFYVLDYLRHKLCLSVTHRIWNRISAHWKVGWQDRNGGYLKYDPETDTETETPYDAFWQFDLRIYRQSERLNIFIEASNIFDSQHQDIGNITLPGRWVRGGVALTLKKK